MTMLKMKTSEVLPRETWDRVVQAVTKVMVEMHVDKTISSTSIFIQVESFRSDKNNEIIGFNVKLDKPVDEARHALPCEEPSDPGDTELDELDVPEPEPCDEPMWSECVSIAHHNFRFHHKAKPRIVPRRFGGVPNQRGAKRLPDFRPSIWKRLPDQIVAKEENTRKLKHRSEERLREIIIVAKRALKMQEKQDRLRILADSLDYHYLDRVRILAHSLD